MKGRGVLVAALLAAALALAACEKNAPTEDASRTAVLGGYAPGQGTSGAPAPLADAHGDLIPEPHLPANTVAQMVRTGDDTALAVWVQEGHVAASSYARGSGWTPAQPLEDIYGQASDPSLASNGQGVALAVWRHTVGNIQSLRFSRFQAGSGWSPPDVVPGALPRPHAEGIAGEQAAPRLQMDAQGNVLARWASGFDPKEVQVARYVAGQGWTRAVSERSASATPASPARPAPSSAR